MAKKALVVGINNYGGANNLSGCVNDAKMITRALKENFDGSKNYDVREIINVESKSNLYSLIVDLFRGNCDSALFYFSGHGYVDEHQKASIVTPDAQQYMPGISMDDILNIANNSSINNKIIILDCCFAGSMGNFTGDGTHSNLKDGVTILTSSKKDEPSVEIEGHGVFSSLLNEALNGGASDLLGNVTPGSVYSYIDRALGPWEQRPVFKTNVSAFDVLKRVTPPIDKNILRELPQIFKDGNEIELNPSFEPTNNPDELHERVEPYSDEENTILFDKLQKLTRVGVVTPVNADHMYYAAMKSESCRLTALGEYYKILSENGRLDN